VPDRREKRGKDKREGRGRVEREETEGVGEKGGKGSKFRHAEAFNSRRPMSFLHKRTVLIVSSVL